MPAASAAAHRASPSAALLLAPGCPGWRRRRAGRRLAAPGSSGRLIGCDRDTVTRGALPPPAHLHCRLQLKTRSEETHPGLLSVFFDPLFTGKLDAKIHQGAKKGLMKQKARG